MCIHNKREYILWLWILNYDLGLQIDPECGSDEWSFLLHDVIGD